MDTIENDIAETLKIGASNWWQARWLKYFAIFVIAAGGAAY